MTTTPYLALDASTRQLKATREMITAWEQKVADAPLYSVARDLRAELGTLRIIEARLDFEVYQAEQAAWMEAHA